MQYKRITLEIRYSIQALHQAKHSQTFIAKQLGLHRSSISKELSRATPYCPLKAHQDAKNCQLARHKSRIPENIWEEVSSKLKQFHSPEQIAGHCKLKGIKCPSVESIYQYVYKNPELCGYLRSGKKSRRSQGKFRKKIKLWDCISRRMHEANQRSEIGHLEADLLEGKKGTGNIVVIEDRLSRLVRLNLIASKHAVQVFSAMDSILSDQEVKSITTDQGREFILTPELGKQWDVSTYVCHAGCPWEKGSVENTNGLLRQFFPKGEDFSTIRLEEVLMAEYLLNNRPRKVLGYRTPNEVHLEYKKRALAT